MDELSTSFQNKINFYVEDIDFQMENQESLEHWVRATIKAEKGFLNYISFIFCSDEYLYKINLDYLQHDYYTDVITFPYSEKWIEGDIFISIDRTNANALQLGVIPNEELYRVMIHGVLHLLGYKDKIPEEKVMMTNKEEEYLSLRLMQFA